MFCCDFSVPQKNFGDTKYFGLLYKSLVIQIFGNMKYPKIIHVIFQILAFIAFIARELIICLERSYYLNQYMARSSSFSVPLPVNEMHNLRPTSETKKHTLKGFCKATRFSATQKTELENIT